MSLTNKGRLRQNETVLMELGRIEEYGRTLRNTNSELRQGLSDFEATHANYSKAHTDLLRTTSSQFRKQEGFKGLPF